MITPAVARRIYRTLLAIYPAEFRRAYGDDMAQVFADLYRDTQRAHENVAGFWFRALFDLTRNALSERIRAMLKKDRSFVILSVALLIAPWLFMTANITKYELGFSPYYDALDAVFGGLSNMAAARDLLVIGGPLLAGGLIAARTLRISIPPDEGVLVMTFRAERATVIILMMTVIALMVLIGYGFAENFRPR